MTQHTRRCFPYVVLLVTAFQTACFADLELTLTRVASGLDRPVFATHAPGEPDKLFILEKGDGQEGVGLSTARVKVLDLTNLGAPPTTLVTIPDLAAGLEQGALGLAFHPNYQTNGKYYVNYIDATSSSGTTKIVEYVDPAKAAAAAPRVLLSITQPGTNHNGGWIGFNPQGPPGQQSHLFISTGDGGPGGYDASGSGQNLNSLLSKILRIDVDGTNSSNGQYGIPATNPFVGTTASPEIFAYGVRNTFRASFDRDTGDLYMGDVGQKSWEEVNIMPADLDGGHSVGGQNYGWVFREGTIKTPQGGKDKASIPQTFEGVDTPLIDPYFQFPGSGKPGPPEHAITGGYVYRGQIGELQGKYIYGDYVTGVYGALEYDGSDPLTFNGSAMSQAVTLSFDPGMGIDMPGLVSFGEDAAGNLYFVDIGMFNNGTINFDLGTGEIYRVTGAAMTAVPEPSAFLFCFALICIFGARNAIRI